MIVKAGITELTYTKLDLAAGSKYTFVVQARSHYGLSDYSASIKINAGQRPDKPVVKSTSVTGSTVTIEWYAPNDRGSAITSYNITIRQSDNLTYSEDLTDCDGAKPNILG